MQFEEARAMVRCAGRIIERQREGSIPATR